MAKKIRKQSKKNVGIQPKGLIGGIAKGISSLFELIADLEKQGKSEYKEEGEIKGKTKSGKDVKGIYGFQVKVGLNPEDFRGQKKLPQGIKK
ncbi:MAG: hypothetical protein Q8N42_01325 [bacterium]|nr:hypothetical protein [bacterium]